MTMIDYATTLANVDAALLTSSGANLTVGQTLRDALATAGNHAAMIWVTDVDNAKTAWVSNATTAFDAAKAAADKVLGSVSSVVFNEYDSSAILALLAKAKDAAANATVAQIILANIAAVRGVDASTADYTSNALSVWGFAGEHTPQALELSVYSAMTAAQDWLDFIA